MNVPVCNGSDESSYEYHKRSSLVSFVCGVGRRGSPNGHKESNSENLDGSHLL